MFAPKFTPKFIPKILSYSSQTFALKLSSIFPPKKLSPKQFTPPFTPNVLPPLFNPKIFPHNLWFSPHFPPDFPPIFSSQTFFPQVYSQHLPPIFAQRFSPIALRLLPPNFPLVSHQKCYEFWSLTFTHFFSAQSFSPIVLRIVPQYVCPQVYSQIYPQDSFL